MSRFNRFYKIISRQKVCVYCGVRATTIDHFVPISVVAILAGVLDDIQGRVLVPACGECNAMAGNNIFKTIAAKRRFIQAKIRHKYCKVLDMPAWQQHEIDELGYAMQDFVLTGEKRREWVRQRLSWHNGLNSEPVLLATVRSNLGARGKPTAAKNASRKVTTGKDLNLSNPQGAD